MKIRDLLKEKGFEFIAVDQNATVDVAIHKMVDRSIGAVLVMDNDRLVGMFTERDVLKCWVKSKQGCGTILVRDVMTKNIMIAELDDDLNYAMTVMINEKIRHLPVIDKGKVVSVISIRDMVRAQVSNLQAQVHYLKDYITSG